MADQATVRLVDFDGFENMIEQTTELEDPAHFVIGTQAPVRDWSELVEQFLDLAFGSNIPRDLLDRARSGFPESDFEAPSMYLENPEKTSIGGVNRIGDAAFPGYAFGDETDDDPLETFDTTLIGTLNAPESVVRPEHPAVHTPAEYIDVFRDVVDEYDPAEYAVFVGAFAPAGDYSIMNEGAIHRVGDTIVPADAFKNQVGIDGVGKANQFFYGTTIVPRSILSTDALELVDGERDEIEHDDSIHQDEATLDDFDGEKGVDA